MTLNDPRVGIEMLTRMLAALRPEERAKYDAADKAVREAVAAHGDAGIVVATLISLENAVATMNLEP